MRNGFAKFAKGVVNFAMRNFAQVGTNEQCIGIAKMKLALRNWHCEFEFGIAKMVLALRKWLCEIFALRMEFGIVKMALRNFRIANGIWHCENGFANSL